MDLALYQPRHGYYSALRAPPGPRGDFYTSPETHPAFGALLARQALEVWERLGCPRPFVVEEWGAGSGRLATDVLSAASGFAPAFAASLTYQIVERGAALRRLQRRALRPWLAQVRWAGARDWGTGNRGRRSPPAPQPLGSIPHLVLANELLDAFAVHRVVRRGDALRELYVDVAGDRFVTVERPPSTPALAAYFARLGLLPPEGAIAEVSLGALAWLRAVAARLARGAVLLFDYGHPAEVLYSARYPRGTLRAYYRHGVDDNPYARVGEQDLTTHVDLTSLLLEGRATGLVPLGIARQRDFLLRLGLAGYEAAVRAAGFPAAETRASLTGLAALARPGGLGDYWVVGFGRGLAGALHGLDEHAPPLAAEPSPTALRPRLGWGDASAQSAPRRGNRRGAPSFRE
ncbi:MAG TPA: SAM-dependent methyltransferase [Chloroflexota bacterium]|nr:SAM-dependent methyltransferase [Chloroflexota bacterium]